MTREAVLSQQERTGAGSTPRIQPGGGARAGQVLLLAPSRGLGGGIERYVQTVQSAFGDAGVASRRLDLARSGPAGHRALLAAGEAALAGMPGPVRVVIAHRALLPVAAILARSRQVQGVSVICHGSDIWGSGGLHGAGSRAG